MYAAGCVMRVCGGWCSRDDIREASMKQGNIEASRVAGGGGVWGVGGGWRRAQGMVSLSLGGSGGSGGGARTPHTRALSRPSPAPLQISRDRFTPNTEPKYSLNPLDQPN
ncbi:hypothetical protein B5X24_HaOG204300 [Helicoverpa armigera]|uniref:Uncharacterized protein n=1 Tax=Helicoverpa armigera TaxID=29058 RepID=A0A2W1BSU6_HELAM|nr:hypothetical protein B5X24_HaOG204300 [Helicoverpa armigera]